MLSEKRVKAEFGSDVENTELHSDDLKESKNLFNILPRVIPFINKGRESWFGHIHIHDREDG
jgi:hypothetical protein